MDSEQEEIFQIATLIVVVVTALVCMCYFLIFLNPQIALNPLKPPLPTPTLVAGLPPTWTPTRTMTPTVTPLPTATPTVTRTPLPPPTSTRTRVPTRRPTTRIPAPPPPPPSPYSYVVSRNDCRHSGASFIEGTVWSGFGGSPQKDMRVALSSGPGPGLGDTYYVTSGTQGRSDGYYNHIIRAAGSAPGTYFVWVADGNGTPLSDPNAGRVTMNNAGPDTPGTCWHAIVDFARR